MVSVRPTSEASAKAWDIAAEVPDPEVPVLTIADLGVLREVTVTDAGTRVVLTPTYSGCPAIDQMRDDVITALTAAGYEQVTVDYTLAPAWTTDWITESGKQKLEAFGIAPPSGKAPVGGRALEGDRVSLTLAVKCPRCHSLNTREVSRFGSTACKAFYECDDCLEPFDYFKVH